MRGLRTLVSALCILGGALLIVGWVVSSMAVRAVEDGTALTGVTRAALSVPSVVDGISAQVQDQAVDGLADEGLDVAAVGLEGEVRSVIDDAVRSPAFEDAVVAAVNDAEGQFTDALTDALREPAPLILSVDLSEAVNARIDEVPAVGSAAPDVTLPPVTFEAVSASTFETVRTSYGWMERVADWGLWAGVALLGVGLIVSHRRRWFAAKALLALGVVALGFGLVVRFVDDDAILGFLPGGSDGTLGAWWGDVVADESGTQIATRAILIGGASLAAALIAFVLGRTLRRR